VGAILEILGPYLQGWELAAWMTQLSDELDGRAPVDVWADSLQNVLEAAEYEAARLQE
jgi:hypothetical protein